MGTTVHLVVTDGSTDVLDDLEALIRDRHARWSRFDPASEVSALGRSRGRPVVVTTETYELVGRAIDAWRLTGGAFDPTVGSCLTAAGYDRDFPSLAARPERSIGTGPSPAPGPLGVELHPMTSAVVVPRGVVLDLGGIAKGATADRAVGLALERGAAGCCVNIGGDLAVGGVGPDDRGWTVLLECPGAADHRTVALAAGAVCTSSTTRRRWKGDAGEEHHLRDPATGRSLETGLATASVIAARGDQAEVLAKAALAAGPDRAAELLAASGVTGILVDDAGSIIGLPGVADFLVDPAVP